MQDRPTQDELLAALEGFLDNQVVAGTTGALSFNGRVAANVVRMLRRELEREDTALGSEWLGLDSLLGAAVRPTTRAELRRALSSRNEGLCDLIRSGEADEPSYRASVIAHVRQTIHDKLIVTNPSWVQE